MTRYQIIDEPTPGPWARIIVNPFWPLLSLMLSGAWLAWPWFLINGHALGSATRRKEQLLVGVAFGGSVLLALLAALTARSNSVLEFKLFGYALLAVRAFKLALAYMLFLEQQKSFQIFETFGGKVPNAAVVVAAGYAVGEFLFSKIDNLVLLMILT